MSVSAHNLLKLIRGFINLVKDKRKQQKSIALLYISHNLLENRIKVEELFTRVRNLQRIWENEKNERKMETHAISLEKS